MAAPLIKKGSCLSCLLGRFLREHYDHGDAVLVALVHASDGRAVEPFVGGHHAGLVHRDSIRVAGGPVNERSEHGVGRLVVERYPAAQLGAFTFIEGEDAVRELGFGADDAEAR